MVSDIDDVDNDYADILISNHALEHVFSPFNVLQKLIKKIHPGGLAVFVVPCESYKNSYTENDINQHLYTWSPLNLGNLFKTAGFNVLESKALLHRWPPHYQVIAKHGREVFEKACRIYGEKTKDLGAQVRVVASRPK